MSFAGQSYHVGKQTGRSKELAGYGAGVIWSASLRGVREGRDTPLQLASHITHVCLLDPTLTQRVW